MLAAAAATLISAGAVDCAAAVAKTRFDGGHAPAFNLVSLPVYGGEPSLITAPNGVLFDGTPSGGMLTYRSTDEGQTWIKDTTPDPNSGDNCLFSDQASSVYQCNLAGTPSTAPLQADVWKTTDNGQSWKYGDNTTNTASEQNGGPNACGTSCNPFGVDRDWGDAYIQPGGNTNDALVVLMYHDFYGPSHIWVNISHDGGKTFAGTQDILTHFRVNSADQAAAALAYTACSSVPIGLDIAKSGPHTGRVYASWLASDPESFATGCNTTQAQSFHTIFTAYSDDNGATWTPQLAYDAGLGHDASSPFAAMTLDDQGNPYIAFTTQDQSANPATCSAEGLTGTLQSDASCAYHMWVVWSKDGGDVWDGGGGVLPGSAAQAYEVDPSSGPLNDQYPAIAVGDPGHVDVAWLSAPENEPTDPAGKYMPGGCAGPGPKNGNPTTYPDACQWKLMGAQSMNMYAPPQDVVWHKTTITQTPMHIGDICNLGIACAAPASNRNLLDFIMESLDLDGHAHIAFTDDNKVNKLRVANQTDGPSVYGGDHDRARKAARSKH